MDNLISRRAVYHVLDCIKFINDDERRYAFSLMEQIEGQPEHKTGKWIDGKRMKFDGTFYWFRQCDQCGYERNDCDTEKDSNFCPDCGADMRGEQHETD